jgi:hypothetical protein
VRNGRNSTLFDCGDVDALSRTLAELAGSVGLRNEMGQASLGIISRRSYEQCREGLRDAFASVERWD